MKPFYFMLEYHHKKNLVQCSIKCNILISNPSYFSISNSNKTRSFQFSGMVILYQNIVGAATITFLLQLQQTNKTHAVQNLSP